MAELVSEVGIRRNPVTNKRDFFLCYECGETFCMRAKYEEHVLLHQAILFCYQVYEYETGKIPSNTGVENDKPTKKGNFNRRNTFSDYARKRSDQFLSVSTPARRKSTYPFLSDERNSANKGLSNQRKELRRKKTLSKSPSNEYSLDTFPRRKFSTVNSTPLYSLTERRGCAGRPHKRKRGETVEAPKKVTKTEVLRKPIPSCMEVETSFSGEASNIPSSSCLIMDAASGSNSNAASGTSQKNEEYNKDSLSDDRSCDASFPALSTTSSVVSSAPSSSSSTSSSSSSLFLSPSSDSSSPSSDSIASKKKVLTKPKRVNRDRDKDHMRGKTVSVKNEPSDEGEEIRNETEDDIAHGCHDRKVEVAVEKDDKVSKEPLGEGVCSPGTGQQCKLKCKTKKRCDDAVFENRSIKPEKVSKKLLSETRSVDRKSKSSKVGAFLVRDGNLKEANSTGDNSPEGSRVKNGNSKANMQTSNTNPSAGQKCVACDFVSFQGTEMIEHVTRKHDASVVKLEKKDCVNGVWSDSNEIEADDKCSLCDLVFGSASDYFIHVILLHKPSLFAPGADRFTCTAHLAHPHLPTHKINITLKRPQPQ